MSGYGILILNSTGSVMGTLLIVNGCVPGVVIISVLSCLFSVRILYFTIRLPVDRGLVVVFYVIVSGLSCRVFCG